MTKIVTSFSSNSFNLKKKEILEEENEDDLSNKLKKGDSHNETSSQLSKSKSLSKIGNPDERIQIILKKHELNEKKLDEKKKINENEVFIIILLILIITKKFKECTFAPKINEMKTEKLNEKQMVLILFLL